MREIQCSSGVPLCLSTAPSPSDEPNLKNGSEWFDSCPISDTDRLKIGRTNAIKMLRLDRAPFNLKADADMEELQIGGLEGNTYGIGLY